MVFTVFTKNPGPGFICRTATLIELILSCGSYPSRFVRREASLIASIMDASSASSPDQQLLEYESQLTDVVALLESAPDDAALLNLKADLEELIAITRPLASPPAYAEGSAANASGGALDSTTTETTSIAAFNASVDAALATHANDSQSDLPTKPPPKKKQKKVSEEFEVPQRLIVLDTDTEAEATRKRRAIKALKSKWRERKKEAETAMKQQSWQTFQKKKKTTSTMFGTLEGDNNSKVGVATSGRHLTQTGERKRHNVS